MFDTSEQVFLAFIALSSCFAVLRYKQVGQDSIEKKKNKQKRILFIRHGEGEHNALHTLGKHKEARATHDPRLTVTGREQAFDLRTNAVVQDFCAGVDIQNIRVVCSPLQRTIETCWCALGNFIRTNSLVVTLNRDIQETGQVESDVGHSKFELQDRIEEICEVKHEEYFNMNLLSPQWQLKKGLMAEVNTLERVAKFQEWLLELPEENIIVVGHHNSFMALLGVSFLNCEPRVYTSYDNETLVATLPPLAKTPADLTETDKEILGHKTDYAAKKYKLWNAPEHTKLRKLR